MNKRTLVIGDIHGSLKALLQVLERAEVTTADKLIFLGDYVDGWSESAAVVDHVIQLQNKQECVFIKGNHDLWCEDWLRTGDPYRTWLLHGGYETIQSYEGYDETRKKQHLDFFQKMPYYFIDEGNRLFIHAGFTSLKGPQEEFQAGINWDRSLWEMALTMNKRVKKDPVLFPKLLRLFEEIYIGHTPTLYYHEDIPMNACNVWNIDTGAAFTGKLSILDIQTKDFWQSDAVQLLHPGEAGRNKL